MYRDIRTGLLVDGTAVVIPMRQCNYPATVQVVPAGGDTVTVEYSLDGTNYVAWTNGAATATSIDVLDGPVQALRFTRSAGSGTTSRYTVVPRAN